MLKAPNEANRLVCHFLIGYLSTYPFIIYTNYTGYSSEAKCLSAFQGQTLKRPLGACMNITHNGHCNVFEQHCPSLCQQTAYDNSEFPKWLIKGAACKLHHMKNFLHSALGHSSSLIEARVVRYSRYGNHTYGNQESPCINYTRIHACSVQH